MIDLSRHLNRFFVGARKTEVYNIYFMRIMLITKQNVLRLEISMDVTSFMQIFQAKKALMSYSLHIDDVDLCSL